MIKEFAQYYKPHKWLFLLDMVAATLVALTDLVFPQITRWFVNDIIPNRNLDLLWKVPVAMFGLYLIRFVLDYIVGFYGHLLGVRMEYDMRKSMFAHLQKLSFKYYDETKTGHIMSRLVNDLNEISELAHHGPEDLFISSLMLLGSFVLLLGINVQLTLIVFTVVPMLVIFAVYYNNKMRRTFRQMREKLSDINAGLEDSISGVRVVKSFTNEAYEEKKFDRGNDNFKSLRTKSVRYLGIFGGGISFFSNILNLTALAFGGYFLYQGKINTGDLFAYIIYMGLILQPVKRLANFVEMFQRGMAGFRRFTEVMAIKPEIVDKPEALPLANVRGAVEFQDVGFSYGDREAVLSHINLTVPQGQNVAIVGPSGVGKTTLCNLIPRFYELSEGTIAIDGHSIQDVTMESLRGNIGIVQQDVFLFSGTVYENILYGRLDAGRDEVVEAAKKANAYDFILEMPEGFDTYIGERGVKLSGGQKQRLSIARMFLKNPPVLILDEATSSLDNQSEAVIQASINELAKDRTTFIIAHRMGTIKNAERIIVLTEKGIEEDGTHQELMKKRGEYFKLYNSQFTSLEG
ncbi:ABC transporter ATP-binding protein [Proteiniclasticum sp. BAD-10]|uniref:ABC transporter ATP-binding protein n=1 Tax=Proteiniclasticum sediminis TaxID=2804028 RepID=A0A941CQH9_9CLOT|nr:ABC transporter ATP-binding protein [Proteiniclasticum sediminis]MBR0576862.1 ABC transporter ATP-binding protein [Proteiniclasticum sediminis]